jgi:hypothetical protein
VLAYRKFLMVSADSGAVAMVFPPISIPRPQAEGPLRQQ